MSLLCEILPLFDAKSGGLQIKKDRDERHFLVRSR